MSDVRGLVPTIEIYDENRCSMAEQAAYQMFGEISNLKKIQAQLVEDLEKALNLVVSYQRSLKVLRSPDPDWVEARQLLTKYKMVGVEPAGNYKVYADGVDLTLYPDSIKGSVVEETVIGEEIVASAVPILEDPEDEKWKDEQGTDKAELVSDEHGNLRLRPVSENQESKD